VTALRARTALKVITSTTVLARVYSVHLANTSKTRAPPLQIVARSVTRVHSQHNPDLQLGKIAWVARLGHIPLRTAPSAMPAHKTKPPRALVVAKTSPAASAITALGEMVLAPAKLVPWAISMTS
tara:strand:- start:783 stop:1157 length:375 start_codon:yes stop_codon:yes gene_type:complete